MTPKTMTLCVAPTSRTDLLCVVCGGFRTELAIVAAAGGVDGDAHAGVHRKCLRADRAARLGRRRRPESVEQRLARLGCDQAKAILDPRVVYFEDERPPPPEGRLPFAREGFGLFPASVEETTVVQRVVRGPPLQLTVRLTGFAFADPDEGHPMIGNMARATSIARAAIDRLRADQAAQPPPGEPSVVMRCPSLEAPEPDDDDGEDKS
jgi:hypothetical protein